MNIANATRYQIKLLDTNLTDLVHEIATQVVSQAVVAARGEVRNLEAYPAVFGAIKDTLREHVRGFHVCGCRPHCDMESGPTELADPTRPQDDLRGVPSRSPRIRRYVLLLDIPLTRFCRALEVRIMRAVAEHTTVNNWRGLLFPIVKRTVEVTLGRYLYYSPTCNQGQYICETGVCTEFDPWTDVVPRK